MSAPPDAMTQMLQGLLGNPQQQAPQGGLMSALNQALAPYGGVNQVALSLLGNKSGGSSFGSVLGQSLQNSQQSSLDLQANKLKLAQQALQTPQLLAKAQDWMQQMQAGAGPGTTLTGASALTGGQPSPQGQPQGAQGAPQTPQSPAVPVPQERQPTPPQSDYSVPQVDLGSLQVGGRSPAAAALSERLNGKDITPAMAAETVRKAQLQAAQSAVGPRLNTLDSIIQSQSPTSIVRSNPAFLSLWRELAPSIGASPTDPNSFTDGNVRQAFGLRRNDIAGWAQLPRTDVPVEDIQTTGPLNSKYATDPRTGKITQEVAPQETATFLGPNGKPVMLTKAQGMAQGLQPYNQVSYGAAQMSGAPSDLMAALAAKGVSLPGNGRNMTQTSATLNALMRNNPDKTPDQIADMVRMGQLDFNGAKRSTAQIATLAAATDIQSNQITKNFDSLAPLVQKNGIPVVNGWINSLQRNLTPSGDKDATAAQGYLLAIAGEYAKLRSGSTGAAAPAEGEMRISLDYIKNALTQGGFDGARTALVTEAQNKRASVREGLQSASAVGTSVGNGPQGNTAPAAALQYLKDNPQAAPQFKAKYGYLP